MKNFSIFKLIPASVGLFLVSLSSAQAANLSNAFETNKLQSVAHGNYNTSVNINQTVGFIIQSLLSLLGVVFLVLVIYAGITWMTAEGDESKVEKAQKIMRNSIIGLVITVSAYAISFLILNALTPNVLNQ